MGIVVDKSLNMKKGGGKIFENKKSAIVRATWPKRVRKALNAKNLSEGRKGIERGGRGKRGGLIKPVKIN